MNDEELTFEQLLELWPAEQVAEASARGDSEAQSLHEWLQTAEGQQALNDYRIREALIRERLNEVAIPGGASERLLARWEQVCCETPEFDPSSVESQTAMESESVALADKSCVSEPAKRNRSRWMELAASAALVLTAVGSLAAWRLWLEPQPMGKSEVAQSSLVWAGQLDSRLWQSIDAEVLNQAPIPEELGVTPIRFGVIGTDLDSTTIVYDLVGPEEQAVLLYVIDVGRPFDVPNRFNLTPDYSTGQFAVGSMQRSGRLYVLMVEGDARRFRQRIRSVGPLG